jgi:hypothetical protein
MGILQDERTDIWTHLKSGFTSCPIRAENKKFNQNIEEFVDFFIRPGRGIPVSLGNTLISYEKIGILVLSIFTPKDTGTDRNKQLADELITLFLKQQVGDSTFNYFEYIAVGESEERYRGNLLLYYRWKKCI